MPGAMPLTLPSLRAERQEHIGHDDVEATEFLPANG